jgi:GDP-L-fucose synthase
MKRKKILITGCSGLVGTFLLTELLKSGFDYEIVGVDLKEPIIKYNTHYQSRFLFLNLDLTKDDVVTKLFNKYNFDYVINCFGIKGSPVKAKEKPVDFLYPSIKINTEIINQCALNNVFLIYVSSVGVYSPAEKFHEDDVWKTLPSEHDWFPSWSKRIGEMLLESYKIQYGYDKWSIIRPANIFGDYDDYSGNGTVISSTIKKIYESEGHIECWGDGSPIRDFVYGKDVALAIKKIMEEEIRDIINFGSGIEITIKSLVESLVKISGKNLEIRWDTSKPNGDLRRQMDTTKQEKYGLLPTTSFEDALSNTYHFYLTQFPIEGVKFNVREFLTSGGYYFGKIEEIIPDTDKFKEILKEIYESTKDNSNFGYRFDYKLINEENANPVDTWEKKLHYSPDEIIKLEQYIKEKNGTEVQRWWETQNFIPHLQRGREYFHEIVESLVEKIYPKLKNNFNHQDAFTIYENGDHITPHNDGENRKRYCVVLIYLSDENGYNDGGGELKVVENNQVNYIKPVLGNYVILDFTLNNPDHSVEKVKNNFRRLTYIDFIHDKKLVEEEYEFERIKKEKNIL